MAADHRTGIQPGVRRRRGHGLLCSMSWEKGASGSSPLAPSNRSMICVGRLGRNRALARLTLGRCALTFPAVFVTPVFHNRVRRFAVPFFITPQVFQRRRQKILLTVVRRTAERLQQTAGHENRNLIRRKSEEPSGLLFRQSARWSLQIQKFFNVLMHIPSYTLNP